MGALLGWFFGEADSVLVKEIAKNHKVDAAIVEKHYKAMLEAIKDEVSNKVED